MASVPVAARTHKDEERAQNVLRSVNGLNGLNMPAYLRVRLGDYIADAIAAARREERERCAIVADAWATDEQRKHGNGGPAAAILALKG